MDVIRKFIRFIEKLFNVIHVSSSVSRTTSAKRLYLTSTSRLPQVWKSLLEVTFILFLLITNISSDTLENKIEWEKVEGAIQYTIQVRKEDKSLLLEEKTSNLFYEISLEQMGVYEYRIGAENKLKSIAWTDWQSLALQKKESDTSKKKILLEWEENPQAIKYSLEIEDETGKNILKKEIKPSKATIDLPEGKYRYRVSAINKLGNSSTSDWESLEVQKKVIPIVELPKEEPPKTLSPDEQSTERWKVIRRSALLPGWGQYYRNDINYRTFSYPLAFSFLIPIYYINYKKNVASQNKYDSDISLLTLTQNSTSNSVKAFGALSYLDITNTRSELNTTYAQGNHLALLIAGVYILNLVDAAFFYDYSKPISERQTTQVSFQSFKRQTISFQVEAYSELSVKVSF